MDCVTRKNKKTYERFAIWVLLALFLGTYSGIAHSSDKTSEKIDAAKQYIKIYKLGEFLSKMFEPSMKNKTDSEKEAIKKMLSNKALVQRLENITVEILVKTFTKKELIALTEFYSSKTGQSIMIKMPKMLAILPKEVLKIFGDIYDCKFQNSTKTKLNFVKCYKQGGIPQ